MLTLEQKTFYQAHGYLHVKGLITPHEQQELSEELEWIFSTWANHDAAWQGPWREKYMSETESSAATLIAMNDMHLFSDQWNRMTGDPALWAVSPI